MSGEPKVSLEGSFLFESKVQQTRPSLWTAQDESLRGIVLRPNSSELVKQKRLALDVISCSNAADDNGIFHPERCVIERASQVNHPHTNFDLRVQTKTGKQWCNLSTLIASDESGVHHAIHIVRPREMRKRLEQAMDKFVRAHANGDTNVARVLSSEPVPTNGARLTSRELEVLGSLAKGQTTRNNSEPIQHQRRNCQ